MPKDKKLVYIAHPIAGDVNKNLNKIVGIVQHINKTMPDVVPFVPYFVDCIAMNDDIPSERKRGMDNGKFTLEHCGVDELWVYGDRISSGVESEIYKAFELGIEVIAMSKNIEKEFDKMAFDYHFPVFFK